MNKQRQKINVRKVYSLQIKYYIGPSLCSVDSETGANINQLQFQIKWKPTKSADAPKQIKRNSAKSGSTKPVTRRRNETRNLSYPELESFR